MTKFPSPGEGSHNLLFDIMFLLVVYSEDRAKIFPTEDIIKGLATAVNHRSLILMLRDFAHGGLLICQRAGEVLHFGFFCVCVLWPCVSQHP